MLPSLLLVRDFTARRWAGGATRNRRFMSRSNFRSSSCSPRLATRSSTRMLAPLLGLNIPFRQSFSAIVMSFTIASAILGAFSPLIAFMVWNTPDMAAKNLSSSTYNFIILAHVAVIALAGRDGQRTALSIARATGRQPCRRVSRLTGVVGWKSISRQPAFVDSAAIHRLAHVAGGIFPQGGVSREFL